MPAINQTTITRNIGPASIYVDCTAPASFLPMTHTTGVPTGGRDVGATTGQSTFKYQATIEGIAAEQVGGMLAPHMTSEDASITCTILEVTYQNLLVALGQGVGTTTGGVNRIGLGGTFNVPTRCVCLVAKASDQNTYDLVTLYQAASLSGVTLTKKRGQPEQVQVTFTGIPDSSRTVGDQLGQFVDDTL
jgi:hypothetical protein